MQIWRPENRPVKLKSWRKKLEILNFLLRIAESEHLILKNDTTSIERRSNGWRTRLKIRMSVNAQQRQSKKTCRVLSSPRLASWGNRFKSWQRRWKRCNFSKSIAISDAVSRREPEIYTITRCYHSRNVSATNGSVSWKNQPLLMRAWLERFGRKMRQLCVRIIIGEASLQKRNKWKSAAFRRS